MAGDRDGNPFVTSECTREAVYLCQFTAMTLYFKARALSVSCLQSPPRRPVAGKAG